METLSIVKAIDEKINVLENIKRSVKEVGDKRAEALSAYDKAIAICILRLKANDPVDFEGRQVVDIAVSVMEKVAKGVCWKEKLESEKSEGRFRSIMSHLDTTKAQLNALQSILRYTEEL